MLRMRHAPRALAGGFLAVLALSLAACGSSSGLLSGQQAASLTAALNQVHASLRSHDCAAAESEAAALKGRVQQLPSSVNPKVRDSLAQGADTVERLVARDCTAASPHTTPPPTTPPPTTTTTTPTTTKTTPTTPATTPTNTGTTTGPTTPTTPTTSGPPPGHGPPGKGHGNGHGHGKGGHDHMPPTTP